MKKKISITIDEDLLEEVDEQRGLIPRSKFIEEKLARREGLEERKGMMESKAGLLLKLILGIWVVGVGIRITYLFLRYGVPSYILNWPDFFFHFVPVIIIGCIYAVRAFQKLRKGFSISELGPSTAPT